MWRTVAAFFVFILVVEPFAQARPSWPHVVPVHERFHVSDASSTIGGIDLDLSAQDGSKAYTLSCHPGGYDSPDDYSGLMQCYFRSLRTRDSVSTLFTETERQQTDWENRGRFLPHHILPGCSEYPEWGSIRHFYLRGMKVTLSVKNVRIGRKGEELSPQSYDFFIDVVPDPAALRSIAAKVQVVEPHWFYYGKSCN